ncbi:MAG: arsenate reductase (azurin) small subunit [Campylobacterales bacterium]|nr:arsenate reductase (azurin) small subunit [Campylobacterales bacterium]
MAESANSRRDFLRVSVLGFGAATLAPTLSASEASTQKVLFGGYAKASVGSLKELQAKGELDFFYPDANSLCKAVFVDGEAKAFSVICTHKGCPTVYDQGTAVFTCGCHFTKYDAKKNGQMIIGHATGGLPQVRLEIEGDALYATGVDGLIFGRIANTIG